MFMHLCHFGHTCRFATFFWTPNIGKIMPGSLLPLNGYARQRQCRDTWFLKFTHFSLWIQQQTWHVHSGIATYLPRWARIIGRHPRAFSSSKNVNVQEHYYKIKVSWYRTPVSLHKILLSSPDACWRCNAAKGDILHLWWMCPELSGYWEQVHDTVKKVTEIP